MCTLLRSVIVRSSAPIHGTDGSKVCLLFFYGQQDYLQNRRAFGWVLPRCCVAEEDQECCQSVEGGWKKKANKIWTGSKFYKTCNYEDENAAALIALLTSTSAQPLQKPSPPIEARMGNYRPLLVQLILCLIHLSSTSSGLLSSLISIYGADQSSPSLSNIPHNLNLFSIPFKYRYPHPL